MGCSPHLQRSAFPLRTPLPGLGLEQHKPRGVLDSQRGDFDNSAKDYRRALRLNPKLAAAYYNRGNDELKQKKYRKAIRDYTKSLELYPGDPWAMKNRGLAWKGLGETAEPDR